MCVFVHCNYFRVFVKLPNVGTQGSGDMPLLYLELYDEKHWTKGKIFNWKYGWMGCYWNLSLGGCCVCVPLMLQFCQCFVKPNVCVCVCVCVCFSYVVIFFGVLWSQMCVPNRVQKMLLLYLGLYNGYQSKGRILIDDWTDGLLPKFCVNAWHIISTQLTTPYNLFDWSHIISISIQVIQALWVPHSISKPLARFRSTFAPHNVQHGGLLTVMFNT